MTRTPNQNKALKWFCDKYRLKPQLSTHPTYYFRNENGDEVTHSIIHITAEWDRDRKTKKPQELA